MGTNTVPPAPTAPIILPTPPPPPPPPPTIGPQSTPITPLSTGAAQPLGKPAPASPVTNSYLHTVANIETEGRPNQTSPTGAKGLYQFTPKTWDRFAPAGGDIWNQEHQKTAMLKMSNENAVKLAGKLGRPPSGPELYVAHQQGLSGGSKLLMNPDKPAGQVVSPSAIRANGGDPSKPSSAFTGLLEKNFIKHMPSGLPAPPQEVGPARTQLLGGSRPIGRNILFHEE